jgi:hypothetical protein
LSNFYNRLQEVAIILKNLNNFSTPQLVYNWMWLNLFMDDYYLNNLTKVKKTFHLIILGKIKTYGCAKSDLLLILVARWSKTQVWTKSKCHQILLFLPLKYWPWRTMGFSIVGCYNTRFANIHLCFVENNSWATMTLPHLVNFLILFGRDSLVARLLNTTSQSTLSKRKLQFFKWLN